ncbi:MAG TPA: choice-of-anchor tandem repeat GloVer-containing protein [Rhizomicrobium sp.]|nr:choice-of-anchor tandem repeat GloVer-containing protein [Rhizomicrobium sp.]
MKNAYIGLFASAVCCVLAVPLPSAEAAKSTLKSLHSFGRANDGIVVDAGLVEVNGTLYGTTVKGGTYEDGTLFALGPDAGTEDAVVYSFCSQQNCADGANPVGTPIDVNGTLYGTTSKGGTYGKGTVFALDPGNETEQVLYSFGNSTDGAYPDAGLIDVSGTLYGTTKSGGASGNGTVFAIDASSGAETMLYSFCSQQGCPDGSTPLASLIDESGTLYGTTQKGGAHGGGTVFAIDASSGAETVLYSFCSQPKCADGQYPEADLLDVNGTLYGTTFAGGANRSYGTVFSLDPGTGTEAVVYSFCGKTNCKDGEYPYAGLLDVNGTLYGTTGYGGTYNGGVVFSLDPGTGAEQVLGLFCTQQQCTDGGYPEADLIEVGGALYGTTQGGGVYGDYGTIFALKNP